MQAYEDYSKFLRITYPKVRDRLIAILMEGMCTYDIELDTKLRDAFCKSVDRLLAKVDRHGISQERLEAIEFADEISDLRREIEDLDAKSC